MYDSPIRINDDSTLREGDVDVHAMAGAGTFAEKTLLPKQAVVKIDPDIPLDIASLIGWGVMTGLEQH
ncbi:MAG: hypothetical protein Ct9H90mP5_01360 [Acidimicrobiaceae bacterium]|nr:MAG: hypothetical protein Ct9H90mP5_01360 [Acidimicrobiaceae bacterium]